jgi:hypothetical protein
MRKYLIPVLCLATSAVCGQDPTEEAIILNQELQFLENSVKNIQTVSIKNNDNDQKDRALNSPSLEKTYFGEDGSEDQVNTKSAGPRRRGL